MVDAQSVDGTIDLFARPLLVALVAFGRQEESSGFALQPGRDAKLGVAVTGRRVDMIDAVAKQDLECLVSHFLRHAAQRRRAKDDPRALVPGASELSFRDHVPNLAPGQSRLAAGSRGSAKLRRA